MEKPYYKLIACNVFTREVCRAVSESDAVIDLDFTELGEHVHSERLRTAIQDRINAAASDGGRNYTAVLLAYGLCGNATVGLTARNTPLAIPRAHDCCTILLGSRSKFQRHFENCPSCPFSSAGYLDRGEYYIRCDEADGRPQYGSAYDELVRQYGRENADYVWRTMHPESLAEVEKRAVFIDLPETSHLGRASKFAELAAAEGKEYKCLPGDLRLLRMLTRGEWDEQEFLVVPPGWHTVGRYDADEIIACEPAKDMPES